MMGWLSNLWHGKGHEQFDKMALALAQATCERITELKGNGTTSEEALRCTMTEMAVEVRRWQQQGMNLWGYARLLKSYADALVMLGFSRNAANQLKSHLRSAVLDSQVGA